MINSSESRPIDCRQLALPGGVGIPAAGIAIILVVDRPLDTLRTVVNVTGDMVACLTAQRLLRQ